MKQVVAEAILVSLLIGFLTTDIQRNTTKDTRNSEDKLADLIGYTMAVLLRPFIALGFFYIVMLFI